MKTKERAAAAGGRPGGALPQGGDRLPFAPRERKPALAALAVLLILVGALGTTVLVLRAGNTVAAVQVTEHVAAGQEIPQGALEQVMMPEDSDVGYVRWDQRGQLDDFYAASDIVEGSLLVSNMIEQGKGLETDQTVVGVSVSPGQYPATVRVGSTVDAYYVGDGATTSDDNSSSAAAVKGEVLVSDAKVQGIDGGEEGSFGGGTVTVNLLVDKSEAGALLAASSEEEVGLSLVSGSN